MASRYWVGGTGVWDETNTAPWAASSGGAGGQTVPGTADAVFFDSISNPYSITLAYSPTIQTLGFTSFSGTFDGNNQTITLTSGPVGLSTNSSMTLLGSPSINSSTISTSTVSYSLTNLSFGTITVDNTWGPRAFTSTGNGYYIDTFNRRIGSGSINYSIYLSTGIIKNWLATGTSTKPLPIATSSVATTPASTITILNTPKNIDYLQIGKINSNTSLMNFYAGKNSTFTSYTKGFILSDGIFNYNTPKEKIIILESGTSWTVPDDFTDNNTIHLFGGGGGGGSNPGTGMATGGGGGGYTKINNLSLSPGNIINYSIGLGGAANTNGGNTTFYTYTANGGYSGTTAGISANSAGGLGGTGLTSNGGAGGDTLYNGNSFWAATAGGGAGGPYGNGTNGLIKSDMSDGGGGGSNGGGSAPFNYLGGLSLWPSTSSNLYGSGGSGGRNFGNPINVGSGQNGGNGVDIKSSTGSGGGGGAHSYDSATLYGAVSGNGGLYGGGGAGAIKGITAGVGGNGAVIIVYTSSVPLKHRLSNTGNLSTSTTFDETIFDTNSIYFDGNDDYLTISNNATLQISSGDFTLESWVYYNEATGIGRRIIGKGETTLSDMEYFFQINNSYQLVFSYSLNGTTGSPIASTGLTSNTWLGKWNHVAATRSGSDIRVFLNGNIVASGVQASNFFTGSSNTFIGATSILSNDWSGNISNLRMVKGNALYTSAFTVPNRKLTRIANTVLLLTAPTRQPFKDFSVNDFTLTPNGNVAANTLSPFTPTTQFATDSIYSSQFDETTSIIPLQKPVANVASITKTVFFTTTGYNTYTLPSDFSSLVSVEAIGGGGAGGPGNGTNGTSGGGGAYAKSNNITGLFKGDTVYVYVGTGGTTSSASGANSWFNTSNSAPVINTTGCLAVGGTGGSSTTVPGWGGAAANCIGNLVYSGGSSGTTSSTNSRPGAGAAAGPSGNGGNGGNSSSTNSVGGGGGGSNGGSNGGDGTTVAGSGGNGVGGTGGGGPGVSGTAGTGGGGGGVTGVTALPGSGGSGSIWTQSSNGATAGPGGGAGGSAGNNVSAPGGAPGGLYGGGGGCNPASAPFLGTGGQGIVVLSYVSSSNVASVPMRISNSGTLYVNGVFDETVLLE